MRKYRFRLESVLSHRVVVEDIKQRAHAALHLELAACAAQIDALRRQIRTTMKLTAGATEPETLVRREIYVGLIEKEIERLVDTRRQIEARLETARVELLAASHGKKAIERVQERDFQRWRVETAQAEQSEMDEIAISRHGRKE